MSAEDPTEELEEIMERAHAGRLPRRASEWADGAWATARDILDTIEDMQGRGVDAPTEMQAEVLENIYHGACRWLHREP